MLPKMAEHCSGLKQRHRRVIMEREYTSCPSNGVSVFKFSYLYGRWKLDQF